MDEVTHKGPRRDVEITKGSMKRELSNISNKFFNLAGSLEHLSEQALARGESKTVRLLIKASADFAFHSSGLLSIAERSVDPLKDRN